MGEATSLPISADAPQFISIHASRGGSDRLCWSTARLLTNFNPRFPWGKRLEMGGWSSSYVLFQSTLPVGEATQSAAVPGGASQFQSTLPVGEATGSCPRPCRTHGISIHASRGGSDGSTISAESYCRRFQSTLPVGEATWKTRILNRKLAFQSTLPVGEATDPYGKCKQASRFQSTLPVGEATG